ncbi:MAG: hypothetical protein ACHQ50_00590 [Fimbriimonadales bacterium]
MAFALQTLQRGGLVNGDFETGNFRGWIADPAWVLADDSRGYYSGWQGRYWAWSGGKGERATGVLKSQPFVLDRDGVRLLVTGWNSLSGGGKPRRWNYVTLNLAGGTELDRVYAPNTTAFVPAFLDGSKHKGERVFVQAVDDADEATYSMLGIDDVRTADLPAYLKQPLPPLPPTDKGKTIVLENSAYLLEFSRSNGALTRLLNKETAEDLILEPRLGNNFRFALPIPGKEIWQTIEANWIQGCDQKLSTWQIDGAKLTLTWKGPLKNYLGHACDVSANETVELRGDGVSMSLGIDNRTTLPVGETYFPMIGGLQGLGTTRLQLEATEVIRPMGDGAFARAAIFRVFDSFSWLGDHGPEQYYLYPGNLPEPWVGFSCSKTGRGVVLGARPPAGRKLVAHLELIPSSSGTVREDGNWPRPSELRGLPVGVELSFVDVAGGPARSPYKATPTFLQFLRGDGPEMARASAAWRAARVAGEG